MTFGAQASRVRLVWTCATSATAQRIAARLEAEPAVLAVSVDPHRRQVIARYDGARTVERELWERSCGDLTPRVVPATWLLQVAKLLAA